MSTLAYSEALGRVIRQDPNTELGESTRVALEAAVRAGDAAEAKRWLDYFIAEIDAVWYIFGVWDWYMARYYIERKGEGAWAELLDASIAPWVGTTAGLAGQPRATVEVNGPDANLLVDDLPWPVVLTQGDERFDLSLDTVANQQQRWSARRAEIDAAIDEHRQEDFDRLLEEHVAEVKLIHDIVCDWAWGLLTVIGREWGEENLGEVQRQTLEPWVTVRYEALKEMDATQIMQITVEGMRGHFTGPGRTGSVDVTEEADRYVLSFDACGTGGRMRRGDPEMGSGSRYDAPYEFMTVDGAYDWSWNQEGVCAYCTHCSVVNQVLPIENIGRPMRLTEYPQDPDDPCRWIIYKDGREFPDLAYTAVGKSPR